MEPNYAILLYVPNIIGYVRVALAVLAFALYMHPPWCILCYSISITLDGFDGYFARKLNQISVFGAWFDIIIDLFSRGYLWCALFRNGYLIVFLEWVTFVATHAKGENWKIPESQFPVLVTKVMANNFKTPLGFYAIGSLHMLPLWMYGYESRFLTDYLAFPMWCQLSGIVAFVIGRTICAFVECFYVKEYIRLILTPKETTR